MNFDDLLTKEYDATNYNCGHFVAEVYQRLTGENISQICQSFNKRPFDEFLQLIKKRIKLKVAKSPCVAIMKKEGLVPHAGIFLNNRILHIDADGVKFSDLSFIESFYKVSFYR